LNRINRLDVFILGGVHSRTRKSITSTSISGDGNHVNVNINFLQSPTWPTATTKRTTTKITNKPTTNKTPKSTSSTSRYPYGTKTSTKPTTYKTTPKSSSTTSRYPYGTKTTKKPILVTTKPTTYKTTTKSTTRTSTMRSTAATQSPSIDGPTNATPSSADLILDLITEQKLLKVAATELKVRECQSNHSVCFSLNFQ
jgi:hypothetical protein